MKETRFAIERHENMKLEEQEKKKQIVEGKLKPKGQNLLRETE